MDNDRAFEKFLHMLWRQPETGEPPTPRARAQERALLRLAWDAAREYESQTLGTERGKDED